MAPAAKSKPANGSAAKAKPSAASTNGTTTPVSVAASEKKDTSEVHTGKPDKKLYDAEQERIKGDIDALQVKIVRQSHSSVFILLYIQIYSFSRLLRKKSPLLPRVEQGMRDGLP